MPTIKRIPDPYRLFFYRFDCNEPMHVHAQRERATCKFWLDLIVLASNHGLTPRDLTAIRRIVFLSMGIEFWRRGVSTAAQPSSSGPRVRAVEVTEDLITAHLADGRTLSVALAWSWRLPEATPAQRTQYEIIMRSTTNPTERGSCSGLTSVPVQRLNQAASEARSDLDVGLNELLVRINS